MSTSNNSKAEATAIARRLNITTKQFFRLTQAHNVEPETDTTLYSIQDVVTMLNSFSPAQKQQFQKDQKPTDPKTTNLYDSKFLPLKKFTPTDSSLQDPVLFTASTHLTNPYSLRDIAEKLHISVRRAKEFTTKLNLPQYSVPNRKQKVWEKADIDKKLKYLSKQEALTLTLWQKQYSGGAHLNDEQISKLLKVHPTIVKEIKHQFSLERTYPITRTMVTGLKQHEHYDTLLKELNNNPVRSTPTRRQNLYISQAELANRKSLTPSDIKTLVDNGTIPTEPNGRILRETANKLAKAALKKKLTSTKELTIAQSSDLLNVSSAVLKRLIKKFNITPISGYQTPTRWVHTYKLEHILTLKDTPDYKRSILLAAQRSQNIEEQTTVKLAEQIKREKTIIEASINVNIRERNEQPEHATLYVGPTNSGKTYTSLEALFSEYEANPQGTYVYAGPLRMLAYEVYEKMAQRYGTENVGFLTGEEQLNPTGNLLACTVEMAPEEGTSLVLDETHWIVDETRGQHWTNLLIGGKYSNLHILTAAEAVEAVSALINDSKNITIKTFQRKTPLNYKGKIDIPNVPPKTAVVCFSRKSVYAVAHELEKAGKKVGVLYGALPLNARKAQIQRYVDGEYDIMVTTDVIGHGINLPIDNVIFAQADKFDGKERRDLHTWEIAQIAGRAGRYGLSNEGKVYILTGKDWFTTNTDLIKTGTRCGAGQQPTDLIVTEAMITPRYKDLGVTKQSQILYALEAWHAEATLRLKNRPITPSPLNDKKQILRAITETLNTPIHPWVHNRNEWRIATEELWQLISGPFNPEGNTLKVVAEWLGTRDRHNSRTLSQHLLHILTPLDRDVTDPHNTNGDEVSPLEESIHAVGELKMTYIMFKNCGTLLYSELLEAEDRLNEAIISTLHKLITIGMYGTCSKCTEPCSPWFRYCEDCFYERQKAS